MGIADVTFYVWFAFLVVFFYMCTDGFVSLLAGLMVHFFVCVPVFETIFYFLSRGVFTDGFFVRKFFNRDFEIVESVPGVTDFLMCYNWYCPSGLRRSIFENVHTGRHAFYKTARTRKRFISVRIDSVPHKIELEIGAKIVDVNKFVFANMVDNLCEEIEKKLDNAISEKFVNPASSDVVVGRSIPILTEYNTYGVEYAIKVVRTHDMYAKREKMQRALVVAVEKRDDFVLDAPMNNMRTIEKLREMNLEISRLEEKIAAVSDLAH